MVLERLTGSEQVFNSIWSRQFKLRCVFVYSGQPPAMSSFRTGIRLHVTFWNDFIRFNWESRKELRQAVSGEKKKKTGPNHSVADDRLTYICGWTHQQTALHLSADSLVGSSMSTLGRSKLIVSQKKSLNIWALLTRDSPDHLRMRNFLMVLCSIETYYKVSFDMVSRIPRTFSCPDSLLCPLCSAGRS